MPNCNSKQQNSMLGVCANLLHDIHKSASFCCLRLQFDISIGRDIIFIQWKQKVVNSEYRYNIKQKMADRKTKRQSGAFYKKKRAKKANEQQQLKGALEKFLESDQENSSSVLLFENPENVPITADVDFPVPQTENTVPDTDVDGKMDTDVEASSEKDEIQDQVKYEVLGNEDDSISMLDLNDPGTWPNIIPNKCIETLVEIGPVHIDNNYKFPVDEKTGRKFNILYFNKIMENGEKVKRNWLVYSIKLNRVFCFPCKLFSRENIKIINDGYSDWRHCSEYFNKHETSIQHIQCVKKWCELKLRLDKKCTIDKVEKNLFDIEKERWRAIIKRMIAIVQFLAGQCLAFRGTNSQVYERNNGNFLKAVEMIAKFDSVMLDHLNNVKKSKELKTHMPHYLGNHFQNEIIHLLAGGIKKEIMRIVQSSKYFSIILDCTPDVSHTEQITFIVRCVNINMSNKEVDIHEFFLDFYPVTDTTGEGLYNFLLEKLSNYELDVQNIRGQGYDNGSNMRGKNIGLQKRILDINPRALFVPCNAHTLNLVVSDAANSSGEIFDFFEIIQEVYNFFSASTYRWDLLKKHITNLTLKSLSETRWESRIKAIRPLRLNLKNIIDSLTELTNDPTRDVKTKNMAHSLAQKISSFKFICSIIIWHDLLSKIDIVSKMLQNPKISLAECVHALQNLKNYIIKKRNDEYFNTFISNAVTEAEKINVQPEFPIIRHIKKPRQFFNESKADSVVDPKQRFKIHFYFLILDHISNSLDQRFELINECESLFSFLYDFKKMDNDALMKSCMDLDVKFQSNENNVLKRDFDGIQLYHEIMSYREIFPDASLSNNPFQVLQRIVDADLLSCFPNLTIALRIFLTLPVSVASGERSFSKLKIIKNYLRSTMSQEKLSSLALISIEHEISESIDLSKIIDEFASLKARRVNLKTLQ
ncbi:zinc finger MYM-type protein 1-like [Nylanderia fulva]|uniref:zinc finger MYM-type protein 1-like n=1 Tax=Nylanderia fulva TaxID=613905 RepID=UPI0010FB31DB|nr:zinc finger MYM-type protein 1-like [Nylanderia fulva]